MYALYELETGFVNVLQEADDENNVSGTVLKAQ